MAAGLPIFADAKSFGFRSCIGVFCKIWVAQRCQSNSLSRLWCVFRTRSKNSCAFGAWICLNSISVSETDFSDSFRPCSILRLATFWLSCRVSPAFLGQVSPCEGPSAVWISVDARMYQRCVKLCSFGDRLPFSCDSWLLPSMQDANRSRFTFPVLTLVLEWRVFCVIELFDENSSNQTLVFPKTTWHCHQHLDFGRAAEWPIPRSHHVSSPLRLWQVFQSWCVLGFISLMAQHGFVGAKCLLLSIFLALSEWFAFTTVTIEFKRSVFQCQSQLVNPFDSSIFGCLHPRNQIWRNPHL